MSFTAFAFFASDTSSSVAPIQTAEFDVDVAVNNGDVDVVGTLQDGDHTITLTVKDTSTAMTGYCVVTIGGKEYITQQFIRGENGYNTVTFTLKLDALTDVNIDARWGTSSLYVDVMDNNAPTNYIADNDIIDLVPKASTPPTQPDNTNIEPAIENNEAEIGNETNNEQVTE